MNAEKLKLLQASVRTGGKGSVRRKKKVIIKLLLFIIFDRTGIRVNGDLLITNIIRIIFAQ